MATKKIFADKVAGKREHGNAGIGIAEREQPRRGFLGNGLSRTAMVFKIAMVAGHKLTVPEMNRIKDINPRALEQVYNTVLGGVSQGDALFALRLVLKQH